MTYEVIAAARRTTRRRAVAVVVVVLVALAALATGWFFLARRGATAPSAISTAPPTTPSTVDGSAAAGTQPEVTLDTGWAEIAGVELPVSATTGPWNTRDGRARGFARTGAGAVFAAVHLLVRTTAQVGPNVFDPTFTEQVVGPDAASMHQQVAQTYAQLRDTAQVPYGQPVGRLAAVLRGFRIDSYTPTDATVVVLTEAADSGGTPRLAATQVRMRWTGDDWTLVAPAGGTWNDAVLIVPPDQAGTFTALSQGR